MSSISSLHFRVFSQYFLLIAIVFGIGYYYRLDAGHKTVAPVEIASPTMLKASSSYANSYPEHRFCSDKAWKKYLSTSSYPRYNGVGNIGDYDVSFNIELHPDGTITGRYYNTNGTKLDVNGYIESSSGDLHIHLGHGSELSNWTLSPISHASSTSKYVYEGTWGRKNRPSHIIITPEK